jgi:hypothetical protein
MTHFRHAAIAAALIAGTTAANAQTTIIEREPTVIMREPSVIVREPVQTQTVVTTQPLQLTPVQRQTVYRTIVRERVRPVEPTIEYRVGSRVPTGAPLYSVPETVAVEVPAIRTYKYMMVNDRVVLVDPATSQIVADFAD